MTPSKAPGYLNVKRTEVDNLYVRNENFMSFNMTSTVTIPNSE